MQPFTKDLTLYSVGTDVARLQTALNQLGYGQFSSTGFFGVKTLQAVKDFQLANDISPLGRFGPITRAKMNELLELSPREWLYKTAVKFIGLDASPNDLASDEVACCETMCDILQVAFKTVGFPFTLSTNYFYEYIRKCPLYMQVDPKEAMKGDIWLSPTGHGNGVIKNGHVSIYEGPALLSNNSANGTFDRHLTVTAWNERYVVKGGFPIFVFRRL